MLKTDEQIKFQSMVQNALFRQCLASVPEDQKAEFEQAGQGTGHFPAGIFKKIISNVTKNEDEGHGPVPCPSARLVVE